MKKIILGDVEVSRVVEWHGAFATADVLFPSVPGELWRRHEPWLAPDFLNAETGEWQANVQTWVLRSAGRTVLVDTGLGNDKPREVEVFNKRDGDFLDRLAAAGVRPEDVDLVVNTHLHNDHAQRSGYGSAYAFANAFKREYGISAGRYRQQHRTDRRQWSESADTPPGHPSPLLPATGAG